ncbi:MAG: hypothetical protein AB8H86_31845, partial [Polyangiales bacterium]
IEAAHTPDELGEAMLRALEVEERLVDCVAVGVGFVQLGDPDAARRGFQLATRWFDVWASYRAHGVRTGLSSLSGTPYYEAARFVLEYSEVSDASGALSLHNAVRWMEWAQELSPRVGPFIAVHARLLILLERREEAVRMVARHRRRYHDDKALDALADEFATELKYVVFDDAQVVEARLIASNIEKKTRDYILGHAPTWPKNAWTYAPVFEALLEANIPNEHPMMCRLLSALGQDDGRELRAFVESYLQPLDEVAEAVRRALRFVEAAGFEGWELVRRVLASSSEHWIEGVWSYLDEYGPRASFVERAWTAFEEEDGGPEFAALSRTVDPAWTERVHAYLENAPDWQAKELIQQMEPGALVEGYRQLVSRWLEDHTGKRAQPIVAWLSGAAVEDEDALLASLKMSTHSYPGDVRNWRMLPSDEFFRRATRLSCAFDLNSIRVELGRRQLALVDVVQLQGFISLDGQIELMLEDLERAEQSFGTYDDEVGEPAGDELSDEVEYRLPPIRRRLGRVLTQLVIDHPAVAQNVLTRVLRRAYGTGLSLFLRGLELITHAAPEVHREWILTQKGPRAVRNWVFDWTASNPDALTWAQESLGSAQHEIALVVFARRRSVTNLDALTAGYADYPELRVELGEALAALDASFVTRAAFETRAAAYSGKHRSPLRKGRKLPSLRWVGDDLLDEGTRRYLLHLIATSQPGQASALIARLNTEDQRTLAYTLYSGAKTKPKLNVIPSLVLPFGDQRLAACFATDILDADMKGEHMKYKRRIAWAKRLLLGLASLGAKDELTKLAPRIWNDDLRSLLLEHVELEATDRAPSKVDFAWLFGAWAGGAWWVPAEWPFTSKLARSLLWHDGVQALLFNDGFRTFSGATVEPEQVRLAHEVPTASGLVPTSIRRNLIRQLEPRESPRDPAARAWAGCLGHNVGLSAMRKSLRRRGWRVGALDREMIYESFYWEVPRISQGVELSFQYGGLAADGEEARTMLSLTFYRLGTACRPRDFPKGDYVATEFRDGPLTLGEVNPIFYHHGLAAVRAVMDAGSGFDPEWQNRD